MKFGTFCEHQLPRPWADGAEQRLFHEALEQVELAGPNEPAYAQTAGVAAPLRDPAGI